MKWMKLEMWILYYASRVVGLVTFSLDPANKFAPARTWLDLMHVGVVGGVLVTTTATLLVHGVTAKGHGFCLMKLTAASTCTLPLCLGVASAILLNATRNMAVFRKLAADVSEILRHVPPPSRGRGWLAEGAGGCLAASYAALRGWYVGRLVAEGDVDAKVAAVYAYAGMADLVLNLQFDAFQLFLVAVTRRLRGRVQRLLVGKKYVDSDMALLGPGPDSGSGVYHVKTRPAWSEDRDQLRRLQRLYDASHRAGAVAVGAVKFPLLLSVVHHFFDALWHLYLALSSGWLLHCACALSHLSLLLVACVLVHLVVVETQGLAASCSRLLLVADYANMEDEVGVLLHQMLCCRPHVTLCGMVKVDTKLFGGVVATLCTYLLLLYTYGITVV